MVRVLRGFGRLRPELYPFLLVSSEVTDVSVLTEERVISLGVGGVVDMAGGTKRESPETSSMTSAAKPKSPILGTQYSSHM